MSYDYLVANKKVNRLKLELIYNIVFNWHRNNWITITSIFVKERMRKTTIERLSIEPGPACQIDSAYPTKLWPVALFFSVVPLY